MLRVALATVAIAVAGLSAGSQPGVRRTFDDDRPAQPPLGFAFAAMRQPDAGVWQVRRTGTNGYLVHDASAAHAGGFAVAILDGDAPREGTLSAHVRLAAGARSGGLVWRYRDTNNYYAVILDLQRGELQLYRVAGGNRIRLESEDDLELDPAAWHVLKAAYTQDRITVSLGGIRVFQESNRATSSTQPDRAGVMATGDSEVWFDDIRVEAGRRDR